ncbi:MAG: hypothetical protein K5864_06010 [Bacteroidales bacterium]|nr:hypothetical protein [Bacteroidales bacterium]
MRKYILIAAMLCCISCGKSQQVTRVSQAEAQEGKTPEAVAYNFATSIIEEDFAQTVELMSAAYFFNLMPILLLDGVPMEQLFSSEYTHDIVDMRPVVKMGYEVVITDSHAIEASNDVEELEYDGAEYSVTLRCADANDKFYDGSQGDYDTETTVFLVQEEEGWRVLGFK